MDADLVTRAQRGDEAAFANIVEAVTVRFLSVAHRILHDKQLAEDATQQALVKVWKHLPGLRDSRRFEAWSYRLLVKACYSEAKRHRRWRSDMSLQLVDSPTIPDGTGQIVARDQMEQALRRISFEHRAVLVLRYYIDLPIEEVAVALDIPLGTVLSSFPQTYDPPFDSAEPSGDDATLLARFSGGAWRHSATMSDPRLEGDWYRTHEYDAYRTAGNESGPAIIVNTLRIENDEGAWSGSSTVAELAAGPGTQLVGDVPLALVGEGAYEGLTAILTTLPSAVQGCTVDTAGVIFDDAPAATPYLPSGS